MNLDLKKYPYIFKVFLKGDVQALAHAYRRTLTYLAKFEQDFGEDSIPRYFDLQFDEIEGYRVITFMTDGAGFSPDYSDITGLSEILWVMYSDCPPMADTNDEKGVITSRKELFGIPDADYELIPD